MSSNPLDALRAALADSDLEQASAITADWWAERLVALAEQELEQLREALVAAWLDPRLPPSASLQRERAHMWLLVHTDVPGALQLALADLHDPDAKAEQLNELSDRYYDDHNGYYRPILEAAYGLAQRPALRADIGATLAGALVVDGEHQRAVTLLEQALESHTLEPDVALIVRMDLAAALIEVGDVARAAFVLPAREDLHAADDAIFSRYRDTIEGLLWLRRGSPSRAVALLASAMDEPVDQERDPFELSLLSRALYTLGLAAIEHDDLALAADACMRCIECSEIIDRGQDTMRSLLLGVIQMMISDYDEAHQSFEIIAALAEQLASQLFADYARFFSAWANVWAAAEADALDASHFEPLEHTSGVQRGMVMLMRGASLHEPARIEEAVSLFRRHGAVRLEVDALTNLAAATPDRGEACSLLRRALHLTVALASALDDEAQRLDALVEARRVGFMLACEQIARGDLPGALATIHEVKAADFVRLLALRRGGLEVPGPLATMQLRVPAQAMHLWDQPTEQTSRLLEGYLELVRDAAHTIPALVAPSRILDNLVEDHAAVEYLWPGEQADTCLIALLCRGQLTMQAIALPDGAHTQLEAVVERVRGERGEGSRVQAAKLERGLHALHDALIAPLERMLPPDIHALTLCPGAQLADVPFEALLNEQAQPLAARYALTFAISSAQLAASAAPLDLKQAILWRPEDELEHAAQEERWLSQRLADHGVALRRVSSWTPGAGAQAQLIHYAGHAGFMGLARGAGALSLEALVHERFEARPLVVLSACETGRVRSHGEEFVGFLRVIFGAGARAMVCASWRAHDAATGALMTRFYEELLAGQSAPRALQRAMICLPDIAPAWAHPFFWACWRCWIGAASMI